MDLRAIPGAFARSRRRINVVLSLNPCGEQLVSRFRTGEASNTGRAPWDQFADSRPNGWERWDLTKHSVSLTCKNLTLTKNNHDHPVGGDGKDFDFPERSGESRDSGAGYS